MAEPLNLNNQIVIYQSEDGSTQLDVKLEGETVWLSQAQMSELFGKDRTVIGRHIRNIFKEGELDEKVVCAKNAHTTQHGAIADKKQIQEYTVYNLDVIISVGYRVHSQRGVRFRQWATSVLKQYLIKGYAVNERIRQRQIAELRQLVQVVGRTIEQHPVRTTDESHTLFSRRENWTKKWYVQKMHIPPSTVLSQIRSKYKSIQFIIST